MRGIHYAAIAAGQAANQLRANRCALAIAAVTLNRGRKGSNKRGAAAPRTPRRSPGGLPPIGPP
eukprot:7468426-Alexandrium_andersonii.AAC.1